MASRTRVNDYVVEIRGTFTSAAGSVEGVHAKVNLPLSPFDRPRMKLYPSSYSQLCQMMQHFKAAFRAERSATVGGSGKEVLECPELNMLSSNTTHVSHDLKRMEVICEPVGVWHHRDYSSSSISNESNIVFHLTPNRMLRPATSSSTKYDGTCTVSRVRQSVVKLNDSIELSFDNNYTWLENKKDGSLTRVGNLVARTRINEECHCPDYIQDALLPDLDKMLTLASFASTHRCVCVGWSVSDNGGKVSRYDRGGVGRPGRVPPPVLDSGLVPLAVFQQFMTEMWPVLQATIYREAILSAIYSVVPMHRRNIESDYLSMFAALEEIVLVYRLRNNASTILDKDAWARAQRLIRQVVKYVSPDSSEARSMIYDNIAGLNRVPLRRVLEKFIVQHGIELEDLWPIYSGDGVGLGNIRNKIVHGDFDSAMSMGSLGVAAQHLRWTLERVVLSLLGWPINRSEVHPKFIAEHASAMHHYSSAREDMARALK